MSAIIRHVGVLKTYVDNQVEVAVEPGRSVRKTLSALGMPPEIVALVLVNNVQQGKDYVIQDGDVVKLVAVIGGG